MKYGINPEDGIVNRGNWQRLKKLMQKAVKGEKLTIGFLGGSITQGSLASAPETCYAYQVFTWWEEKFPQSAFVYLNAGIGGTDSQFGAARVGEDLLEHQPDFVIVEFSVNDQNNAHFRETYEAVIRKLYGYQSEPAVLIVNHVFYADGVNAQEQHNRIGEAYKIPCISMKSTIYQKAAAGAFRVEELMPDWLHPSDEGHALAAEIIVHALERVWEDRERPEEAVRMPAPITPNEYEHSLRIQNRDSGVITNGFYADPAPQESITDFFRKGWSAEQKGASIQFTLEGTGTAVQYRKSVKKPAPSAIAVVDGDEENAVLLDANFDEDWGDCLYLQTLTKHTERRTHTVEVRIIETHEEDAVPFYLVCAIASY